jgi:hypothetical protein
MEEVTQQFKNAKAEFIYKDQREKIERRGSKKNIEYFSLIPLLMAGVKF